MNTKILEFNKTDHFLYGQWNRKIDDQMLYKILPYIQKSDYEKDVILVLPSFLTKKGIEKDNNTSLILILKKNIILTGYWCEHPNYLFDKEKNAHFQLLYK
jgi:hypothetical protein